MSIHSIIQREMTQNIQYITKSKGTNAKLAEDKVVTNKEFDEVITERCNRYRRIQ